MPPHLGQARIWPIAPESRTESRDLQVVQVMEKRGMGEEEWLVGRVTCHCHWNESLATSHQH